jgi:hypothetical protein
VKALPDARVLPDVRAASVKASVPAPRLQVLPPRRRLMLLLRQARLPQQDSLDVRPAQAPPVLAVLPVLAPEARRLSAGRRRQ